MGPIAARVKSWGRRRSFFSKQEPSLRPTQLFSRPIRPTHHAAKQEPPADNESRQNHGEGDHRFDFFQTDLPPATLYRGAGAVRSPRATGSLCPFAPTQLDQNHVASSTRFRSRSLFLLRPIARQNDNAASLGGEAGPSRGFRFFSSEKSGVAAQNSRHRERYVLPYSDQKCVPFTFHEPSLSKPGNLGPLYRGLPCSPYFSRTRSHFKAPKTTPPPLPSLRSQGPFRLRPEAWRCPSRVIALGSRPIHSPWTASS